MKSSDRRGRRPALPSRGHDLRDLIDREESRLRRLLEDLEELDRLAPGVGSIRDQLSPPFPHESGADGSDVTASQDAARGSRGES